MKTAVIDTLAKESVEPDRWVLAALVQLPALPVDNGVDRIRLASEIVSNEGCEKYSGLLRKDIKRLDRMHPDAVQPALGPESKFTGSLDTGGYRGWVSWQAPPPPDGCIDFLTLQITHAMADEPWESRTTWVMYPDGTLDTVENIDGTLELWIP